MAHRGRERVVAVRRGLSLKKLYKIYYSLRPPLELPDDMDRREFAAQFFESDAYVRHLSFRDASELERFLVERAPKQIYYSIAIYDLPEAKDMEEKVWRGSELLFDIDVDHLEGCEPGQSVVSDDCLILGYKLARRVSLILERDFGASTTIYFTGNRGFHVRASCDYCLSLGREERRELAAYVAGEGLDVRLLFPRYAARGFRVHPPSPDEPGWRGWIAAALMEKGVSSYPKTHSEFISLLEKAAREFRPVIDVQVTQDPSRLFRVPGSLNGKASLIAARVTGDFKPGEWLSPFRGEVEVEALRGVDEVRVMGVTVRLRERETCTLPAHVAIYLYTKGLVNVIGGEVVVRGLPSG